MTDSFAAQCLVGNTLASTIFGHHFGYFGTDAVNLPGNLGNW